MAARLRCDQAPVWKELQQAGSQAAQFDLRQAFAADGNRFEAFSQQAPHLFADLSKNRIDRPTEKLLFQLARECGVEGHRDAMFAGQQINATEQRAVKHWLLRSPRGGSGDPDSERVHATLDAMFDFAERIRADSAITDVVNIGIGGSDLGPQMAVVALAGFAAAGRRFHFVSNVDGHELAAVLQQLRPESTLFLVASKTFTTLETMTNARSARQWF
ncbi:MAG: glucose-6-phosphate isomerase, partial [Ramlibacter sp.]|nr:glucose-6-phosphate isomerase [Ramlibacter sp.]